MTLKLPLKVLFCTTNTWCSLFSMLFLQEGVHSNGLGFNWSSDYQLALWVSRFLHPSVTNNHSHLSVY